MADLTREVSLDVLRGKGFDLKDPTRYGQPDSEMPEITDTPLYALIKGRLTPGQLEILGAVFETTGVNAAAALLNKSEANLRVQLQNIRARVSDVVTWSSSEGAVYANSLVVEAPHMETST